MQFIKPYYLLCIGAILAVTLDVTCALLVPTITADMINTVIDTKNVNSIMDKGLIMLAISLLSGICALLGSFLSAKLSAKVGKDMRNAIYAKSLTLSATDFEQFGTASMITRTLNDINAIQQQLPMFIQLVLPVPIMCVMGICFAFYIHEQMGYLLLGIMVFVMLITTVIVKKSAPIMEKLQYFLDKMNLVLRENLMGIRVIRAFNKENHEVNRLQMRFTDYAKLAIKANYLFAILDSLAITMINFCIVAIFYVGGNNVGNGSMAIGDILAVTEYAIWALFYLILAQMVLILLPKALVCLKRLNQVLAFKPEINDGDIADFNLNKDTNEVLRFDHVNFRFADAAELTLSDLSFSCYRGKTTAIIGGTGSGKSTIAKLILRYHDVTSGSISLQDTDIRKLTQFNLRKHISYVPQKAWLFSGTIADNLRYGDNLADEVKLQRALSIAQADFVNALPDKLNAPVAQGGNNFSGGQKQRLSIARALVKKADLYIFDDSFSALDFQTDLALRQALFKELNHCALLIIAQRVSTIIHADQIIVLNDGKIAGIGTHKNLLATCSIYRDIVQSQMKGEDIHAN